MVCFDKFSKKIIEIMRNQCLIINVYQIIMNIIKAFFFVLLPIFGFSQRDTSSNPVMDFVYKSIGEKVGCGLCHDFVVQAENVKYKDWNTDYYLHTDSMQKHQIWIKNDISKLQEGDIIIFDNVVLEDSSELKFHIGIICKIWDGTICYASQNLGSHKDKEKKIKYKGQRVSVFKNSKVEYSYIDTKKIIDGYLYIFRF